MRRETMRIAVVFREQQTTASYFLRSPLTHRMALDHYSNSQQVLVLTPANSKMRLTLKCVTKAERS